MLILARRIGESIMIGDQVEISVVDIKGDQVKLGIKAPSQVKVYRAEVYAAIQEENRAAASAAPQSLPRLEGLKPRPAGPARRQGRGRLWRGRPWQAAPSRRSCSYGESASSLKISLNDPAMLRKLLMRNGSKWVPPSAAIFSTACSWVYGSL